MENYIVINGKKAELTQEQLKQLGIEVKKEKETPFTRHTNKVYWSINTKGISVGAVDKNDDFDNDMYDKVNYFNDYKFAEQVALHQLLYRKLLKYAYENDAIIDDWYCNSKQPYHISYDYSETVFTIATYTTIHKNQGTVYFSKQEVAENAIEDIVKPFMREHPEFVW